MATLIPQGGVFSGIDRLNESLGWLAQMQENKRRNALTEGILKDEAERKKAEYNRGETTRNALIEMFSPRQVGGPLMSQAGQDYQPVSLQTMQPTREQIMSTLLQSGDYEQAIRLMPEPVRPENYTLTPGAMRFGPNNQVLASAPVAEKPIDYEPFGYGQMRNKQTNETVRVPVAPQSSIIGGLPKPPSGYRYTENNELEAIPGGPAAQKQELAAQSVEDGMAAIDYTSSAIERLINHPGREAATGKSSINPLNLIPGTDAYDFNAELESFDAKLFLANIQQMKGMGALSNAEGAKVSAAAGAIKKGMKEETFVKNLRIIQDELAKAKARKETGQFLPVSQQLTKPQSTGGRPPLSAFQR